MTFEVRLVKSICSYKNISDASQWLSCSYLSSTWLASKGGQGRNAFYLAISDSGLSPIVGFAGVQTKFAWFCSSCGNLSALYVLHSGFSVLFITSFEPSTHIICYQYSCFGGERQAVILDGRKPTPHISLGSEPWSSTRRWSRRKSHVVWDDKKQSREGSRKKMNCKGRIFTALEG